MEPMRERKRSNDMPSTVLIATTARWVPTARLAIALTHAGFQVKAVCPSGHPMEQTAVVGEVFAYRGLAPVASFAAAIPRAQPDLIIPGDDLAAQHLHEVYARNRDSGEVGEAVCDIIEQSLGDPASFEPALFPGAHYGIGAEGRHSRSRDHGDRQPGGSAQMARG